MGWVLIAIATILSLTLLSPWARKRFRFGPLHLNDLAATLGTGILVLVVLEALKPLWTNRRSAGVSRV